MVDFLLVYMLGVLAVGAAGVLSGDALAGIVIAFTWPVTAPLALLYVLLHKVIDE